MRPSGYISAHGRTWLTYSRQVYMVDLAGAVAEGDIEAVRQKLESAVAGSGLTLRITPVRESYLSPEDRAEKQELDRLALENA